MCVNKLINPTVPILIEVVREIALLPWIWRSALPELLAFWPAFVIEVSVLAITLGIRAFMLV